jgi:hypothetical protein
MMCDINSANLNLSVLTLKLGEMAHALKVVVEIK